MTGYDGPLACTQTWTKNFPKKIPEKPTQNFRTDWPLIDLITYNSLTLFGVLFLGFGVLVENEEERSDDDRPVFDSTAYLTE